jgi:hypothetical protein
VRRRSALVAATLPVVVALGAWCGWASGFHRTSGAAELTWVGSTVAVVAVDLVVWRRRSLAPASAPWPRAGRGGSRHALVGIAPWLALGTVAVAWDVLGLDTGPHQYHLTISALSQAYRPLNAAVLLAWMLVGVGYEVARVRAPGRAGAQARAPVGPSGPTSGPSPDEGGATFGRGAGAVVLVPHATAAATPALLLPQIPAVGVAFWIAVPAAAAVIDLVARRSGGTLATAEEFVRFVSTARWANLLLIAAWLFAGYHLFAR